VTRAAVTCALLTALTACGSRHVQTATAPASELHAELAHYDRAIAALRAAQATWRARERADAIAHDRLALAHAFRGASAQVRGAAQAQAKLAAQRDAPALDAQLAQTRQASSALASYRATVLQEERSAIQHLRQGLAARVRNAYKARAVQLDERESTYAYRLAQRDAHAILMLHLRRDDLQLPANERRIANARLQAIARTESAALGTRTAENARVLSAYRAALEHNAARVQARAVARIERRMQANLRARSGAPAAPPPELTDGILALRSSGSRVAAETAATSASLHAAGAQLESRWAALANIDEQSDREATEELLRLERERAEVISSLTGRSGR
jgi:hypothetical protein